MERILALLIGPIFEFIFKKIVEEIRRKSAFNDLLKKNQELADQLKAADTREEREKAISNIAGAW